MSKIIEFKIPQRDGTIGQARGNPVLLNVGERKIKFVLQHDSIGKARCLTHLASGLKFGTLDEAHVELMCRLTPQHRFSKRQLAEFLIDKAVAKIGIKAVLAAIDKAPVIN